MSDDFGKGGIPPGGDPLFDPTDPVAVEREERRREREARRARRAKKKGKAAAPAPPPKPTPPPPPRTPEQEFWDEPAEPTPPQAGAPSAGEEPAEKGGRRRRGLFGRLKGQAPADPGDPASGAAAREASADRPGPPTGEAPIPPRTEAPHRPPARTPRVDPGPRTVEGPRPDPDQPTGAHASPETAEHAVAGAGPATREHRALPPRPVEEIAAGDWEPPPPRDDWFDEDEPFDDEGDPRMAGAARIGRRHGDDGRRRFGGPLGPFLRHPFRVLGVAVLILVLLFLNAFFQPFHGDGSGRVTVTIPKGSSVGEVGELLEEKGVISGGFIVDGSTLFQARVTLAGDRSNIIAGKHVLRKDMSYGDAIDELTKEPGAGSVNPTTVTVTIPEGYTRTQIAQLAKEDGLRGSYMKATKKSKYLDPAEYGGKQAKDLEGFLFPDTWELKRHRPVKELVRLQLADFKKKIKHVNMKYARSKNLTVYDVLTIASIIEHEAGLPSQRRQVASVIYNRLHEGMTLGSDATVRFAVHNYTKPLTQSQLESSSPYNTRVHAGLPPGPISNPGIATIEAAAHPAKTKDLFFVTSPDCKKLAFAKTEAEFEEDVAKYEASKCTE
ncbi:MAG TPA: endolytic transglycosylase MltG [Solirubrobacterales bacterium]|nr:endolytic transglycosylase MltG [Solirubrobacterales bacterium]